MNFNAWVTSSRGKIHSVWIISLYNNKLKAVLKFIFLCIIDNVTVNDGFEKCVDESNVERCERERGQRSQVIQVYQQFYWGTQLLWPCEGFLSNKLTLNLDTQTKSPTISTNKCLTRHRHLAPETPCPQCCKYPSKMLSAVKC